MTLELAIDHPEILHFAPGDTLASNGIGTVRVTDVRVQPGIVVVRKLRWWEWLWWHVGWPLRWLRRLR